MPQERDPSAALVGSRSRQACPRRQQDRPQDRSPQYPGPAHSRTPAARRKPVRLSVPERSRPAPQPKSSVLVPRPARGGLRGRSPSRSPPLPCQPRGDERRAGSGRVPAARSFRCAIDAALRPSGRPGNRGRGRAGRAIYRSALTQLECAFVDAWGVKTKRRRASASRFRPAQTLGSCKPLCQRRLARAALERQRVDRRRMLTPHSHAISTH